METAANSLLLLRNRIQDAAIVADRLESTGGVVK
jgi:hypothetical protein